MSTVAHMALMFAALNTVIQQIAQTGVLVVDHLYRGQEILG